MNIYQILVTLSFGDAVSNDCLAIHKLLTDNGYNTSIYAYNIHEKMKLPYVKHFNKLPSIKANDVIIYHLSTGTEINRMLRNMPGHKIVRYHNMTPAHFFAGYNGITARLCGEGKNETLLLKDTFEAGINDSDFNTEQLISYGYTCPMETVPILIPFGDYEKEPDMELVKKLDDGVKNVLFVGRIAPNKKQEDLISMAYAYNRIFEDKIRVILAGSATGTERYLDRLKKYAEALEVSNVVFTGQIPFKDILAYYTAADAFVCMSEHEGFCVPLAEAMKFETPIIAFDSCAVPETLGGTGILLEDKNPYRAAAALHVVLNDKETAHKIVEAQNERLKNFSYERVSVQMLDAIKKFTKEGAAK